MKNDLTAALGAIILGFLGAGAVIVLTFGGIFLYWALAILFPLLLVRYAQQRRMLHALVPITVMSLSLVLHFFVAEDPQVREDKETVQGLLTWIGIGVGLSVFSAVVLALAKDSKNTQAPPGSKEGGA